MLNSENQIIPKLYLNRMMALTSVMIIGISKFDGSLYLMCQLCIGKLPKLKKPCKKQDMSECEWCCSDSYQTSLVKLRWGISLKEILENWKLLNSNWNMGQGHQEIECDQFVLFPKIYLKRFPKSRLPTNHDSDNCIQEKIQELYNCTENTCNSFLGYLINYIPMKDKDIEASYSFPNGATRVFGKNFVFFKKIDSKHVIDKGALLDPIPPFWWGIILFLLILAFGILHSLGMSDSLFLVVRVALEQSFSFPDEVTLRKCLIILLWSFGCILSRNVYTSSVYSFITATLSPSAPTTLKQIVNDSDIDIIHTNIELEYYTEIGNYPTNRSLLRNYIRTRNSLVGKCTLYDISASEILRYVSFFRNLTSFSEIWCGIRQSETNITVKTESRLLQFALVYHSTSVYKAVFSVLGKRYRFNSNENDFEVKMYVYHSNFRHGFHYYYHDALARFETSGIIGKIQDAYQITKVVKELSKYSTELNIDMKILLNRFHDGESTSSLVYDFGKDGSQPDVEATKIEALMVVWFFYAGMTFACVSMLISEHVVIHYDELRLRAKFNMTYKFLF
ncbi:unnamed protein product [Orchesella dallaii]|uniref:Ionotropic glutamate receptor C-terminal domain-containing protein n=1 Tax=Orchesella dallaii TaxID=48710 RepID=A0ABP1QEY6_9HEXA